MPRSIDDLALDAVGKPPKLPRQEMPVAPPRPRESQVDWPALAQKVEKAEKKSSLSLTIIGLSLCLVGVIAFLEGFATLFLGPALAMSGESALAPMVAVGLAALTGKVTILLGSIVFGVGCLVVAAGND